MANSFETFRKAVLRAQQILGNLRVLRSIEHKLIGGIHPQRIPPIFIIGVPRSGSTLLYQLLIQHFYFTYINNLQSFFYGSPLTVAKFCGRILAAPPVNKKLDSKFGYISGVFSPSEAGTMFRKWFGETDFSDPALRTSPEIVRSTIQCLSSLGSAPFIAKNLYNSLRLATISSLFPEAFFVWIRRDPLYTSQSLINMRRKLQGSDEIWVSVKPPSYKQLLTYAPFEQVVRQIKEIEDYIRHIFDRNEAPHYCLVDYENLCEHPNKTLSAIRNDYNAVSGAVLKRSPGAPQVSLKAQQAQKLPDSDWQMLCQIVQQVYR
jgi:hypothetical protein